MSEYYVSSGQTSTGINLYYDSMYVSDGGTASSTTVNYDGELVVSSGGTAVDLNVNTSGYVYVLGDGAAASRAEVKLGLRNIAYNMDRFCFLMRQTA